MNTLRERLISAREAKNFSQQDLATLAKCGQTTIASIENGRNKSSSVLPRVADILGVRLTWLIEGKGERLLEITDDKLIDLLEIYKKVNPEFQEIILNQAKMLFSMQKNKI